MLIHPRAALASGLAAAAGAALLALGRIDGSLLVAIVLSLVARAAALAASDAPPSARALSVLSKTVPAWVALALVVTLRAGSPGLADVWGANAVAGAGIVRGDPLTVAGIWLAGLAALGAIAAPALGRGFVPIATEAPWRRLEGIALLVQVLLVVGLVAGPQVTDAGDLLPWVLGSAVAAGGIAAVTSLAPSGERVTRAVVVLAGIGLVLAVVGAGP